MLYINASNSGIFLHTALYTLQEVVQGGTGLTFIAFPEALSRMGDAAPVFAMAFFLMMFTLGLDSEVGEHA